MIYFHKKNRPPLDVPMRMNLMRALINHNIPVASSCLGEGVCAKCRVQVTTGVENLSKINETEQFLIEKNKIPDGYRISCQVEILGDVTIDTGYW